MDGRAEKLVLLQTREDVLERREKVVAQIGLNKEEGIVRRMHLKSFNKTLAGIQQELVALDEVFPEAD